MERFADMLQAGGRANSLGRTAEVVNAVEREPDRLGELFGCVSDDDAWVRMRAMDGFEKLCRMHPEWASPYMSGMLEVHTQSSQASIQWHLAQLFAEVPLTDAQRKRAIDWLKQLLANPGIDWIVSANAMKSLVHFYDAGEVARHDLLSLLEIQSRHRSSAVRKKAVRYLESAGPV